MWRPNCSRLNRPCGSQFSRFRFRRWSRGSLSAYISAVKRLTELGHYVRLVRPEIDEQYPDEIRLRPMNELAALERYDNFSSVTFPTKPHFITGTHPEALHHSRWNDAERIVDFAPDIILVEDGAGLRGCSSLLLGGYRRPIGVGYARQHGTPVVVMFETDWLAYGEHYLGKAIPWLLRPILRQVVKNFSSNYTMTLFPSRVQLERYLALSNRPSEHLAFHGVDCSDFCPENIQYATEATGDAPLLLFVGRIAREECTPASACLRAHSSEVPGGEARRPGRRPLEGQVVAPRRRTSLAS